MDNMDIHGMFRIDFAHGFCQARAMAETGQAPSGLVSELMSVVRSHGVKGLWAGWAPISIRAVSASLSMTAYESLKWEPVATLSVVASLEHLGKLIQSRVCSIGSVWLSVVQLVYTVYTSHSFHKTNLTSVRCLSPGVAFGFIVWNGFPSLSAPFVPWGAAFFWSEATGYFALIDF